MQILVAVLVRRSVQDTVGDQDSVKMYKRKGEWK